VSARRNRATYFVLGSTIGSAMMLFLNAQSYFATRQKPMVDGYQVAGFPFVFFRRGGFINSQEFIWSLFLIDFAIALAVAACVGWLATSSFEWFRSRKSSSVMSRHQGAPRS
jgi:hypothetical protein